MWQTLNQSNCILKKSGEIPSKFERYLTVLALIGQKPCHMTIFRQIISFWSQVGQPVTGTADLVSRPGKLEKLESGNISSVLSFLKKLRKLQFNYKQRSTIEGKTIDVKKSGLDFYLTPTFSSIFERLPRTSTDWFCCQSNVSICVILCRESRCLAGSPHNYINKFSSLVTFGRLSGSFFFFRLSLLI